MESSRKPKKVIKIEELGHSLSEKLVMADQSHILVENNDSLIESQRETIESAHYLFRDYLERMLRESANLCLPEEIMVDGLNKIYEKSDFDWLDSHKFRRFRDWYINNNKALV